MSDSTPAVNRRNLDILKVHDPRLTYKELQAYANDSTLHPDALRAAQARFAARRKTNRCLDQR